MRVWSDTMIQKTKTLFSDEHGEELSTEDAIESLENLTNVFELLIEWDRQARQEGKDLLKGS